MGCNGITSQREMVEALLGRAVMGRRKERKEEFLPLSGPLFHRLLDETAALRM